MKAVVMFFGIFLSVLCCFLLFLLLMPLMPVIAFYWQQRLRPRVESAPQPVTTQVESDDASGPDVLPFPGAEQRPMPSPA